MMEKTTEEANEAICDAPTRSGFNVNKLQAAVCIVASAVASIGLIIWAVCAFL
jgi:hypothetical protein